LRVAVVLADVGDCWEFGGILERRLHLSKMFVIEAPVLFQGHNGEMVALDLIS
jgi:hypothetical protein